MGQTLEQIVLPFQVANRCPAEAVTPLSARGLEFTKNISCLS